MTTHILIAQVAKPQGVRGELKLRPITQDPSRFEGLKLLYRKVGEDYVPQRIRVTRVTGEAVYAFFDGVEDRTAAEELREELLYIDRAHAIELDEDSDFICDLIGLVGETEDGETIGVIRDVLQPGGNDVYVFRKGRVETLVPALKSVVVRVDYQAGKMILAAKRLGEVAVTHED